MILIHLLLFYNTVPMIGLLLIGSTCLSSKYCWYRVKMGTYWPLTTQSRPKFEIHNCLDSGTCHFHSRNEKSLVFINISFGTGMGLMCTWFNNNIIERSRWLVIIIMVSKILPWLHLYIIGLFQLIRIRSHGRTLISLQVFFFISVLRAQN